MSGWLVKWGDRSGGQEALEDGVVLVQRWIRRIKMYAGG